MGVIEESTIVGGDELDTRLLRQMAHNAESYLQSFTWCQALKKGDFVEGYGGILALFLFCADIEKLGSDVWLWVFVGDIPSAYLEVEHFLSPFSAVERYIEGVREWINAVRMSTPLDDLIPISHSKDEYSLKKLQVKLDTLHHFVLQHLRYESENTQ